MSDRTHSLHGTLRHAAIRARVVVSAIRSSVQRVYAGAMILLIVWLCFLAVRYLVYGLVTPAQTPAQIAGVPRRLDEAILHGGPRDWLGLGSVENPRTPASHYHRFDSWLQEDKFNDCTRSGCHSPLPHSRRKEDRAFLNMHATSIHCGVCHFNADAQPLDVAWYSLTTGKTGGRPALLEAHDWLSRCDIARTSAKAGNSAEGEFVSTAAQSAFARLLHRAAEEGGAKPGLVRLARDIAAVRAGSQQYLRLLDAAQDVVRNSLRGSYGSKLALLDDAGSPRLAHAGSADATREWLERGAGLQDTARDELLARVHPSRRERPLDCSACHRVDKSRIDFARLGYPADRIQSLANSRIFEMIQHIREGRPFYLPDVGATPESQP